MNQVTEPGVPLLVIVEGENDICFLTGMSQVLRRSDPCLPNLWRLEAMRRIVFMPSCGSNLVTWAARLATLGMREFYLFDREQEPETSQRQRVANSINGRPGCFATLTTKRTVENYLHPHAIREACGIDLTFDDDTDVAGLLALKLMEHTGESSWRQLPYKRQRRLHEKAKKILNMKAVQRMTPALLSEQDPDGELIGWLRTIGQMVGDAESLPVPFTDRELATILASLRYWQQDLAANEEGPISEHFHEHTPLTVDEIDDLVRAHQLRPVSCLSPSTSRTEEPPMPTSASPLRPYPDCPLVVAYGLGVDSTAMLIEFASRGIKPDLILFADTGGGETRNHRLPRRDPALSSEGWLS